MTFHPVKPPVPSDSTTPDWFNVVDYGADPTGTNDSTTVIQSAINAVPSGGGVVYFPAGTYKLSSALTVNSNTTLRGDGANTSVLSQTTGTANGLSATDIAYVTIRDLQIKGPATGSGVGISFGLSVDTNMAYLDFTDLLVTSFGSHGISLRTPIVSKFERVVCANNGGDGFHLTSATTCTSCSFVSCFANANSAYGYNLANVSYSQLVGCASDANDNGYLLNTCQGVTLTGCGSEAQTVSNFILEAGNCNTIVGCWVRLNVTYGIHVTSGEVLASLVGCLEDTASSATNFIKVDSGCTASVINCQNITANSFASNTTTQITGGNAAVGQAADGTAGDFNVNGTLNVSAGATIKFGSSADTDLYRLGSGELATDGSFTSFTSVNYPLLISGLTGGGRISQGSGAPSKPNSINPVAGDIYFRTDTPSTADQRIYICTVGGGTPTWVGVV